MTERKNSDDNPTILVTGGAGYIGSHTVVELQNRGYRTIVADNLSNSTEQVIGRIGRITGTEPLFYRIDLKDKAALDRVFAENRIDATIHFAASKAVGESVEKPLDYYKNNLLSLIHVLEAIRDTAGGALVFSSSCTVYGEPEKMPVVETDPVRPAASPYGNTKRIGEEIIGDAVAACPGLKAVCLRYFNPIGAHPSALIGELPLGVPLNLMPYITQTAAGIHPYLNVFGDDYPTRDGTCIRDYIHVVDLARAHVRAIERFFEGKMKSRYETFNLGTGHGYTVLEVIRSFEKTSGIKLDYRIAPRRAGDIARIWADPSLANRELGWEARLSLDEMTRSAWQWQKQLKDFI